MLALPREKHHDLVAYPPVSWRHDGAPLHAHLNGPTASFQSPLQDVPTPGLINLSTSPFTAPVLHTSSPAGSDEYLPTKPGEVRRQGGTFHTNRAFSDLAGAAV